MLESLRLKNVGPAPEMTMELGSRLNLITGDNGLGKSFLLDVAWWALTRRWPQDLNAKLTSGYPARPTDIKKPATITFGLKSKTKSVSYSSTYVPRDQSWLGKAGRPSNPALVIYAQADGSFSVWDPARNYWKSNGKIDVQERLPGYVFSPQEVWNGLEVDINGKPTTVCNGLLRDWASWIREGGPLKVLMTSGLGMLSPSQTPPDLLEPGPLTRISLDDARDIPSLKTGYSESVPILYASSGVRRIVSLAYILVWSYTEHVIAARLLGARRTTQVVMLIDELEGHLHPRWQRSILRPLLDVTSILHRGARIQLVATTHSPLILAAAEPFFDTETDAWFDLDLNQNHQVELVKRPFVRLGDISNWLTSQAFDLKEARSLEAETAVTKALAILRAPKASRAEIEEVDQLLRASLSDVDRFWLRWSSFRDAQEIAS